MVLLTGLGVYWLRTSGRWRVIYANLFGAACCYTTSSLAINVGIDRRVYYTGSSYDIALVALFFWFGAPGLLAYRLFRGGEREGGEPSEETPAGGGNRRNDGGCGGGLGE